MDNLENATDAREAIENDLLARAVEATESEIFEYGVGDEPSDPNEAVNFDRSPEQTNGWDGLPLSADEQWEGYHPDKGFDRPVEYRDAVKEHEDALARADAAEKNAAALRQQYDPEIRAKAEADRANFETALISQVIDNPGALAVQMQQAARQQAQMMRANETFADAHETHGEETFRAAFSKLTQIGAAEKQRYGTSATVREILESPNPGKALMSWARSGSGQTGSGPPFMPQMQRSAAPRRGASPETMDDWGTSHADYASDQDIMNYALR